jgi:hypothetical protein
MSKKKEKIERYIFSSEEIQRMESHLENQIAREEVMGLLDKYSCSFADWSIIISEAVHDAMERKRQSNEDCEKERKMLDNLSYLFTKLAYSSQLLSDWHKQLTFGNEQTKEMIKNGHP